MEDLSYLYTVWPRVTMGQITKKKFLEWLFLGMSSCGVHGGREGLSNLGEAQEVIAGIIPAEPLSDTDHNLITFTLPGEGKVPKLCTVTLKLEVEWWGGQECGWAKRYKKTCHHLKVTCLQQTVIQRHRPLSLDTDSGSFCHPTATFCSVAREAALQSCVRKKKTKRR